MNIAVVGGAGYIGSHVALALKDAGHTPIIFDNLSLGLQENIDATKAAFFKGDIRNPQDLKAFFSQHKIDAVIHLAAFKAVGESMQKPGLYMDNNITGTIHLVNAMLTAKIKTLVFSSSAAVYGQPEHVPVTEEDVTLPTSVYGFTKLECERILRWYQSQASLRVANLRYFNVVGYDPKGRITGREKSPQNLFPLLFETAIGERKSFTIFGDDFDTPDGSGVRDYIHVTDLADAHVKALEYLQKNEELTINLATGHGYSVKQCVEAVKKEMGEFSVRIGPKRAGDPAEVFADPSKAHKLLHWHATHSDLQTVVKTMKGVYKK